MIHDVPRDLSSKLGKSDEERSSGPERDVERLSIVQSVG